MKLSHLFEKEHKPGTYIAAKFNQKTLDLIESYIKDNNIPNATTISKMHLTLLSSEQHLPKCKNGTVPVSPEIIAYPINLDIFTSPGTAGQPDNNCLVMKVSSDELTQMHSDLLNDNEAIHKYGEFKPHITLSYNIGDMDIKKLPDIKEAIPEITIDKTFCEPFKEDWARSESTT